MLNLVNVADLQFEILNLFHVMTGCMGSGVDTLQTHARRRQTTALSSNCCLQPVSKRVTVPPTGHCLSLLQAMYNNQSFMIPVFRFPFEWPLYIHTYIFQNFCVVLKIFVLFYVLFVLCRVCVQMCTVQLPLGGNPIAVNKYIKSCDLLVF
jgi:hypothetical protein